jgi:hypothetical protein
VRHTIGRGVDEGIKTRSALTRALFGATVGRDEIREKLGGVVVLWAHVALRCEVGDGCVRGADVDRAATRRHQDQVICSRAAVKRSGTQDGWRLTAAPMCHLAVTLADGKVGGRTEEIEDLGAWLVHRGDDGVPCLRKRLQSFHNLRGARISLWFSACLQNLGNLRVACGT